LSSPRYFKAKPKQPARKELEKSKKLEIAVPRPLLLYIDLIYISTSPPITEVHTMSHKNTKNINKANISLVTLAAMEDLGWYLANYSAAECMLWGYKQV